LVLPLDVQNEMGAFSPGAETARWVCGGSLPDPAFLTSSKPTTTKPIIDAAIATCTGPLALARPTLKADAFHTSHSHLIYVLHKLLDAWCQ
jgi:hypothetical protein